MAVAKFTRSGPLDQRVCRTKLEAYSKLTTKNISQLKEYVLKSCGTTVTSHLTPESSVLGFRQTAGSRIDQTVVNVLKLVGLLG